uniref:Uncharacterized protein n=1 Tax=Ditylenchus dipsaci TaxID=166011 RepID=A0A915D2T0_9BILA
MDGVTSRGGAQLNGSDADGAINGKFVWTSSLHANSWNSTDEHGQKSNGFMCNQIYLRFPNPNNTTQSELSFNNLKMSVYLDLDTLPNTVSSLHMNVCGSDTLQSSCMMSWLAYNWTMLLFCMILMGVAVAITHKIYMSRQRITTRYNIAAASNPFSLEDFDDVDVWTPFENGKRKKNLPKMIY